jgi:hypothetical protein
MANTETKTFYKGEVEITFYPDSHRYKLAGERSYLTSVTAITGIIDKSRVLIPWAVGLTGAFLRKYLEGAAANNFTKEELYSVIDEALVQHTVKKEAAADIGSQTHDLAQKIGEALRDNQPIEDIPEDTPEEVKTGVFAFVNWVVDHNSITKLLKEFITR